MRLAFEVLAHRRLDLRAEGLAAEAVALHGEIALALLLGLRGIGRALAQLQRADKVAGIELLLQVFLQKAFAQRHRTAHQPKHALHPCCRGGTVFLADAVSTLGAPLRLGKRVHHQPGLFDAGLEGLACRIVRRRIVGGDKVVRPQRLVHDIGGRVELHQIPLLLRQIARRRRVGVRLRLRIERQALHLRHRQRGRIGLRQLAFEIGLRRQVLHLAGDAALHVGGTDDRAHALVIAIALLQLRDGLLPVAVGHLDAIASLQRVKLRLRVVDAILRLGQVVAAIRH